jgi:hypothetical protein
MKSIVRFASLVMLLGCEPEGPITGSTEPAPAPPGTESSQSAVVTSTLGDTAFFAYGDYDTKSNGIGHVFSDLSISLNGQTTSGGFTPNAKATMNRNGWVFVTYTKNGGSPEAGPSDLMFAMGKVVGPSSVNWIKRDVLLAQKVGYRDHDVALTAYDEVAFFWFDGNRNVLSYSTGQAIDTTMNFVVKQKQVDIPGVFANPRISFGGSGSDRLLFVSRPSDGTQRIVLQGRLDWQGGTYKILWNYTYSLLLTNRATTDGVYDIAADASDGFSLAWVNGANTWEYLYHMAGQVQPTGAITLKPVQTEITRAVSLASGPCLTSYCYSYYEPSIGRSADGKSVIITSPQIALKDSPFGYTQEEKIWVFSRSLAADGSLMKGIDTLLFSGTSVFPWATIAY